MSKKINQRKTLNMKLPNQKQHEKYDKQKNKNNKNLRRLFPVIIFCFDNFDKNENEKQQEEKNKQTHTQ